MAVAIGILVEIILVVILGLVEVAQRQVLDGDLPVDVFLLVGKDLIDCRLVILVGVIHAGAVLRSRVMALPVDACRVDSLEIHLQQKLQRYLGGIVHDMNGLGKAGLVGAHLFVGRVLCAAIGIAYLGVHHSVNLLEIMLGAPEATSGEIYLLQFVFFHIFPFYVFFILEIVVDYLLPEWCQCQPHQSEVHPAPRNADNGDA